MGRLYHNFRSTTSEQDDFTRLQSFVDLQASEFAATQVVPTADIRYGCQGGRGIYIRAVRGSLPPRVSDMLAVRIGQLTAEVFHLLDLQLCWLLVPVLSSRPPRQTEKAAKCPEPLCPTRVLPPLGRRDPSPERTLLLRLRSYRLIRRSRWALSSFGFWPRLRVLAGCYQSPLPTAASRRYLQQSVLGCWIPYPGGTPCALTCFFHDVIGLPQRKSGSASRSYPA